MSEKQRCGGSGHFVCEGDFCTTCSGAQTHPLDDHFPCPGMDCPGCPDCQPEAFAAGVGSGKTRMQCAEMGLGDPAQPPSDITEALEGLAEYFEAALGKFGKTSVRTFEAMHYLQTVWEWVATVSRGLEVSGDVAQQALEKLERRILDMDDGTVSAHMLAHFQTVRAMLTQAERERDEARAALSATTVREWVGTAMEEGHEFCCAEEKARLSAEIARLREERETEKRQERVSALNHLRTVREWVGTVYKEIEDFMVVEGELRGEIAQLRADAEKLKDEIARLRQALETEKTCTYCETCGGEVRPDIDSDPPCESDCVCPGCLEGDNRWTDPDCQGKEGGE